METVWYEIPEKTGSDSDYKRIQRDRASLILENTRQIEDRQFAWHQLNLFYATCYNNRQLSGFRWGANVDDQAELWPVNLRTENLVDSVGQTLLAKAASSPLRPTLVPHGASWKMARAVRTGDRFVYGLWRQTHSEEACLQMFNDTYTAGLGTLQVSVTAHDEVVVEPVLFDNVIIDNRECPGRMMPRTFRIRKMVPIETIRATWPKSVCEDTISKTEGRYQKRRPQGHEWEPVIEVWRLPDPDGSGGYHGIVASGHIVFEEKWTESWVPLVFMHWKDRLSGFFTKTGVEEVIPYQVTQNELNDAISETQRIVCGAGVMAPAATQFNMEQWKGSFKLLQYHGMEPKPIPFETKLQELYQERERNVDRLFNAMGLNGMFSMGEYAPSVRFDSSAGLREARNMEDARHLRLWVAFERARLELARTLLRVVNKLKKSDFKVIYKPYGASFAGTEIQWEDIKLLSENDYEWEMAPASLAQMSPAARRETLMAKIARGQDANMGTGQDQQMVTQPDLELIERMELASEEDIERHLDLLENGKYEKPSLLTNKVKGMWMVTANYHRLNRYTDVPRSILQNHERWVVDATVQQLTAATPMSQPQSMTPFAPTQGVAGTQAGNGQ